MTGRGSGERDEPSPGRRLVLTPIGFDAVIALSQAPDGLRLSELAHAIGSPVSSVQSSLRILVASELAIRVASAPPRYRLDGGHPGADALSRLALLLPDAGHATGIAVRANPAVELAVVDSAGFIVGISGMASPVDRARFDACLAQIRAARADAPLVNVMEAEEFARHFRVSLDLRERVRRSVLLKGRIPRGSAPAASRPRAGRGTQERCVRRSTSTPTSGRGSDRGRWGRTPS